MGVILGMTMSLFLPTLLPSVQAEPRSSPVRLGLTWSTVFPTGYYLYTIGKTRDNGIIVGGLGFYGGGYVAKLDVLGRLDWSREYSFSQYGFVRVYSIEQTRDGGFILAGDADPYGNAPNAKDRNDAWILKLDVHGMIEWGRTLGVPGGQGFASVIQTSDGGYLAAGTIIGFLGPSDFSDAWLVKFDSSGNVLWQHAYGGFGRSNANSIQEALDQTGFIVAGDTQTTNAEAAWVFKTDNLGNLVWERAYLVTSDEHAHWIRNTSDGGYVLWTDVIIKDDEVNGYPGIPCRARACSLILRLNPSGDILWQKLYPCSSGCVFSIEETRDGGFIEAGASPNAGLLIKLDSSGNTLWQRSYLGLGFSMAEEITNGDIAVLGVDQQVGYRSTIVRTDDRGNIRGCASSLPSSVPVKSDFSTTILSSTEVTTGSSSANVLSPAASVSNALIQTLMPCGHQTNRNGPPKLDRSLFLMTRAR